MKIRNVLFVMVATIIISLLLAKTLPYAFENEERRECSEWQTLANKTEDFELTQEQIDKCNALNVKIEFLISAPINGRDIS